MPTKYTLYHHKTDGGAEYLCTSPVEGTNEGDCWTTIIRLDGEPELLNAVYIAAPDMLEALKATTQALKDILGAADNGEPYTRAELERQFLEDYNLGYEALRKATGK